MRFGEAMVYCAGGICAVCKQRIAVGPAIQLSSKTSAIRHEACMPKEDTRSCSYRECKVVKKKLSD